jgi:hypothetical protein
MMPNTIALLPQNHPDHLHIIQNSGCFFRSSQAIAEVAGGKALSADQINEMWAWGRNREFVIGGKVTKLINMNNELNASAIIANRTLEVLGVRGRFLEVGTKKNGTCTWYPWTDNSPSLQRGDAFIQKINQNGPQKIHFRLANDDDSLLWDPHDPEIKSQGVIYTIVFCFQPYYKRAD